MQKKFIFSYLAILFILFFVMSLSTHTTTLWRSKIVAVFSPIWKKYTPELTSQEDLKRLITENQYLKHQLEWLAKTKAPSPIKEAVLARVIFRPFHSWNSSLWIDKGSADNQKQQIILKNSPVVFGRSIIGVIDYVGKYQSRVRLITDSGLNPSVRVLRKEDGENLLYLAKGELQGSSGPYWRQSSQILKGTGFNYDFADEKGEARDLRTGKINTQSKESIMPLVKIGDTLVTTGMDGVFPPDWEVAQVEKIEVLKEGDYFYELEAKPTAGNLHDLNTVFVIPPIGYYPEDYPRSL